MTKKTVVKEEKVGVQHETQHETDEGDIVSTVEARGIFEARPEVASVVTTAGVMNRDGSVS